MRILLTNDDGINAPGLSVLEEIARELSDDIWIAAPEEEQSGKGRAISLTHPVRTRKVGARAFAITGTPSDCVLLATHDLMPDKPDLVLSGVNRGQNIAEDVTFSGTVAGAMQGMQLALILLLVWMKYLASWLPSRGLCISFPRSSACWR